MNNSYITYREEDQEKRLCFYILQKAYPHYLALLVTNPVEGAIINVPISGYRLWLTWNGTIRGNYIPANKGAIQEATDIYFSMAQFYYEQRILREPKKYKPFKITNEITNNIQ